MSKWLPILGALLVSLPAVALGATGTCTPGADGNFSAMAWSGALCGDLGDNCPGCPDTDDVVSLNGRTITIDQDASVERLWSFAPGGQLAVPSGVTFTISNPDLVSSDTWTCATCKLTVAPGATLRVNAGSNSYAGVNSGTVEIEGMGIGTRTVDHATPIDATHLEIHLDTALSGIEAGDILRIGGGLARGYTFEITAVHPNERIVTVDVTRRDPHGSVAAANPTQGADARHWTVNDGGPNFVDATDEACLGKFLWDGIESYYPIVGVESDPDGGENDTIALFYDAPGLDGFYMAYGFERGGDPATIYRPARIVANGATRFHIRFNNGTRTRLRYADFEGVGITVDSVDNANRPAEYFDFSDSAIHDLPGYLTALQLAASGGATKVENVTLERLDVFDTGGSPMINLSGENLTLRDSMIRDMRAVSGSSVGVAAGSENVLIEDVSILRTPNAVAAGSNTMRPSLTIRRLWAVGTGRYAQTGQGGVIWNGRYIDPADTSPGKNDGRQRTFNSVLWSHSNAEFSQPGRSIGQRVPAVNVVTGYSGGGIAFDNSDGMYRGDSFYSLHTRHGRHGQSECTWCIGNITSFNLFHGLSSVSEFCVYATCTPTPFPRRIRGNLSFGNGQNAFRSQELNQTVEITHNTLVGPTGTQDVSFFDPYEPLEEPSCTESDTTYTCGPDTGNGTGRPPWWEPAPGEQPDAIFQNNIAGDAPPNGRAIDRAGTRFGPEDLQHTYNYYFNATDPDLGSFGPPGAGELVNQPDPFVNLAGNDFRLAGSIPGNDGRNMGAGYAGVLTDASGMPPVYANLIAGGVIATLRNGDLESVDGDGDGKAEFMDFDMTGVRVSFAFTSAPACADPRDCADLRMQAYPIDDSPREVREIRVPVEGSGLNWSVAESAFVLAWGSIEKPAKVRVNLVINGTESPQACWSWTAPPYQIGSYVVPSPSGPDTDGDLVPDTCDVCPLVPDAGQLDGDDDLAGDACDNCAGTSNTSQANNDGDTLGDACDPDDDNDAVVDSSDNCAFDANAGQEDYDGDTAGNACDQDDDNDGLMDGVETGTGVYVDEDDTGSNPLNPDTDGDGMNDGDEVANDRNPNVDESIPTLGAYGTAVLALGLLLAARRKITRSR
jgi:hypothetical protein